MKLFFFILTFCCISSWLYGQDIDTTNKTLNEVTITGYKEEATKISPLNIVPIKLTNINAFNLCDMLKNTEGVNMLSTGVGIAKPVIRGLYGNRVLILLNGLKFDNQQWQEEHGLGLTSFGLSKVELIKGPIGILYGSEAIGGVINLIEEEKPTPNTYKTDLSITMNSNTHGGMIQAGYIESKKNKWWRFRVGADNHADYSDGKNNRILNSRFDGYYFKTTYGFERKNWTSVNNYAFSYNRFGFIFSDVYTFVKPDTRWSRSLNKNPAHLVLLNILSSENKLRLNAKVNLTANIGVQSNQRMENEGGGAISLNMHLLTVQSLVKLDYNINAKHKIMFSSLNAFEKNANFGARKIVPDAHMQESNLSVNYEYKPNEKCVLENGIGIGEKNINTYFTPSVNGQDKEVKPFNKFSPYYNLFSGLSYNPNPKLNFKFNLATGVRVANLAELSSNGLHEGVFTYEIGNPNLKNEQIFAANLFTNYDTKRWGLAISPFYNYFTNYIYLTPVNEQWFGFPVYRYKQQNALQYGAEFTVYYNFIKNTSFKISYSGMSSKTQDGNYTPYIPAQKIKPQLDYKLYLFNKHKLNLNTNIDYVMAQHHTAPYEISAAKYTVWNASAQLLLKNQKWSMGLNINNILNTAYIDHLSRFKNYGLLNIGRNIIFNLNYKL